MNKELIKKYKKEFDWWINGGKLMVADSLEPEINWLPIEPAWTNPNAMYVINDEYVLLRKALAEGKTIQTRLGNFLNGFKWVDMSDKDFHNSLNCYRIKPPLELEMDTKVLVWNDNINNKLRRHFSHFSKQTGKIYCFWNGRTSWTNNGKNPVAWEHWELAE